MWSPDRGIGVALVAMAAAAVVHAGEPYFSRLDRHQTPVPYPGIRVWYINQNLGPTGARGWIHGKDPSASNTAESREILVRSVEEGSPADGILQPYDIILGVSNAPGAAPERFSWDARLELARAITLAESDAGRGELPLLRWRDGEAEVVTLRLPVLGDYAPTAPFDCPKTQRIVEQAAAQVAAHTPAAGDNGMTGAINGLLLLATGEERYIDHVRRTAVRLATEPFSDGGHNTWRWGYVNLFLTEYVLATGDARVLPRIEEYSRRLAEGQCNPGTWGHRSVEGRIPPGYGSMNQAGLVAFMSLVTARQIGVPFDHMAIAHSIAFYGSYAGRGSIPYGDHPPGDCASDNGKNGSAAVVFRLLGAEPAAQWFAQLCASANLAAFEGGHTGNYFNQFWTPIGASLAGRANQQRFWSRFHHYRDLARRWDGTFITQPLPHHREGCLGYSSYIQRGPDWSTSAFALSYLGGTDALAMLGRRRSAFAADAPDALRPALDLYRQKRFADAGQAARALAGASDPAVRELAGQLERAAARNLRSLELTLEDMRQRLDEGDLFLVQQQLRALESIVDPADPRLAAFHAAVNDPTHADTIRQGEQYHSLVTGHLLLGRRGFEYFAPQPQPGENTRVRNTLTALARNGDGFYGRRAAALLAERPPVEVQEVGLVDNLVADQPRVEASFNLAEPDKVRELVLTWDVNVGGGMRVLLNGTTIMDVSIDPGPWRTARNTPIPLKPITRELLRPGENVLTVELHPDRQVTEASCSLEAWLTP